MSEINFSSGNQVAKAIDKRIIAIAKQVANKSSVNRTVYGRVTAKNNGLFSVRINNTIYTNVLTFKNLGYIEVGDSVVCLVPNNQFNNLLILGVADGTINPDSNSDSNSIIQQKTFNGSQIEALIPYLNGTNTILYVDIDFGDKQEISTSTNFSIGINGTTTSTKTLNIPQTIRMYRTGGFGSVQVSLSASFIGMTIDLLLTAILSARLAEGKIYNIDTTNNELNITIDTPASLPFLEETTLYNVVYLN